MERRLLDNTSSTVMMTSGNRKFAASGGNEWGTGLREERYTVNNLNQYTQRTVPARTGVIVTATNTAIVTVNNQPTWRKAEYYAGDVPVDNSASPVAVNHQPLGFNEPVVEAHEVRACLQENA